MLRLVYTFLFYAMTPMVLARLFWRGRKAPAYRQRWGERFALYREAPRVRGVIWFHAVSVGEAEAVFPLVRAIMERFPERPVLITTTTPTGSARVRGVFGDSVAHVYLPYDLPDCIRRFLDHFQPVLAVVVETEIWPNLFRGSARRGLPLVIANARLSEKSCRGYRRLGRLMREIMADVSLVAAQSEEDAERFRSIGTAAEKVTMAGNIKFDLQLPEDIGERGRLLRTQRFGVRPVWLCASTHEGEEQILLEVFRGLRQRFPTLLLVLVPRHPERFRAVAELCRSNGFLVGLHSQEECCGAGVEVYVVDAMGVLRLYYATADIAFVGGSLVPVGGHNALEAAAVGIPVVYGSHMSNFQAITAMLNESGAGIQVSDRYLLEKVVGDLLADESRRIEIGVKGQALVSQNRGTLDKLVELLSGRLAAAAKTH